MTFADVVSAHCKPALQSRPQLLNNQVVIGRVKGRGLGGGGGAGKAADRVFHSRIVEVSIRSLSPKVRTVLRCASLLNFISAVCLAVVESQRNVLVFFFFFIFFPSRVLFLH